MISGGSFSKNWPILKKITIPLVVCVCVMHNGEDFAIVSDRTPDGRSYSLDENKFVSFVHMLAGKIFFAFFHFWFWFYIRIIKQEIWVGIHNSFKKFLRTTFYLSNHLSSKFVFTSHFLSNFLKNFIRNHLRTKLQICIHNIKKIT